MLPGYRLLVSISAMRDCRLHPETEVQLRAYKGFGRRAAVSALTDKRK